MIYMIDRDFPDFIIMVIVENQENPGSELFNSVMQLAQQDLSVKYAYIIVFIELLLSPP